MRAAARPSMGSTPGMATGRESWETVTPTPPEERGADRRPKQGLARPFLHGGVRVGGQAGGGEGVVGLWTLQRPFIIRAVESSACAPVLRGTRERVGGSVPLHVSAVCAVFYGTFCIPLRDFLFSTKATCLDIQRSVLGPRASTPHDTRAPSSENGDTRPGRTQATADRRHTPWPTQTLAFIFLP